MVGKAHEAYTEAIDVAITTLPSTHPTRLGLALSFSTFLYEIRNSPEKACQAAKKVSFKCILCHHWKVHAVRDDVGI